MHTAPPADSSIGRVPGTMGQYTAAAAERLKQGSPGNTLSREQMAAIIGRECGTGTLGYGNVLSAIRHVETTFGVVWQWDRGTKCWRCLDDAGKVDTTKSRIDRSRRAARCAVRVAGTVDVRNLNREAQRDHVLNCAAASMTLLCSGGKFRNRIAKLDVPTQPAIGKLIELMKT